MILSKQIAAILGPTLVALILSEFPLVQPHLYDSQIPPVVYLSGLVLFVGGLAVVRFHPWWARDWTALVTLSGWLLLFLGLVRMFAAEHYRQASRQTSTEVWMAVELPLLIVGLILSWRVYRKPKYKEPI